MISCWIDAWDSQHHTGFLLCITAMVAWWICDIGTFVGAFEPSSTRSRARGRMDIIIEEFSRRRLCGPTLRTKIFANFPAQRAPLDLNLGPSQLSVHRWTSTGDLPSSVCTARPQPGTCPAQCAPLDLNGQIECQKICQIKCHEMP